MTLVEARDMVNNAQSPHLCPDGFKRAMADSVSVRDGFKGGQEPVWRPFEFYEDCEECSLMVLIAWERIMVFQSLAE